MREPSVRINDVTHALGLPSSQMCWWTRCQLFFHAGDVGLSPSPEGELVRADVDCVACIALFNGNVP